MQQTITEELVITKSIIASKGVKKKVKGQEMQSRFGTLIVQPEKAISFPHGLPGMPEAVSFCLANFPDNKHEQFKVLQCMNLTPLSFIVVPATADNQLLAEQDVNDTCAILGIDKKELLLLFIVTAHETPTGRRLSVNAKAPVFVDGASRTATQYVFQNKMYEIQHFIS